MPSTNDPEVWLRGPLPDVTPLLQPVAHALMQAREEVTLLLDGFPAEHLWERPASWDHTGQPAKPLASVGFHLQHLTGVLDRLFTYARAQALSPVQLAALAQEGKDRTELPLTVVELVQQFDNQVDKALDQLRMTNEHTLTEVRLVGRAGLPSTVMGLLVHAAEHTMRHVGQLLVTVRVIGRNTTERQ
ncbi:MAG TPA: DinB family protein [Spirosoma sp.]|nr:DinB family protein [Spirosoma sp.]